MMIINKTDEFFINQDVLEQVTLSQSKGFYHFQKSNGKKLIKLQNSNSQPTIVLFGQEYKVPFTKKIILKIDGDAIKDNIKEKEIIEFFTELLQTHYVGIEYNSERYYDADYEIALRRSGFVKPLGISLCPLTIHMNLKNELKYSRNWKRNIKKGEEANLRFEVFDNVAFENIEEFIRMFGEMADLKGLSFTIKNESLMEMFSSDLNYKLFFVYEGTNVVAGRILHIRNKFATDTFAANSNEARNTGATFFMMDNIFKYLKEIGVEGFDFARIPPSTHASDTVYQFKIGSGGEVKPYMGEWVHYKNKYIEILMMIYKFFKLKKVRY